MIKKTVLAVSVVVKDSHHDRPICYRLSSVDETEQTVILHVINKSIFIKQTFSEIIANNTIIEGLSCEHASWIGIYYGKCLRSMAEGRTHLKEVKKPCYLLKHCYGSYKIIAENRDGTIACIHVKTKNTLNTHPLAIVKDKVFIDYFDANQACYIGILAGIDIAKNKKNIAIEAKKQSVHYLSIVK